MKQIVNKDNRAYAEKCFQKQSACFHNCGFHCDVACAIDHAGNGKLCIQV